MYGNPIVDNMSAYRSFVIYHLKSLRALDGSAIESSEVATAKENYGGRFVFIPVILYLSLLWVT